MAEHDGRYAPSPSGSLHLGNLRTALLAWLFARSQDARFLLRIEDLDPQRSRPEHEQRALADLRLLGLDWDGEPLRQSRRRERHRERFEALRSQGRVYPCWCTHAEIRLASSAPHAEDHIGAYPGTCRALSTLQRAERAAATRPAAWRLDAGGAEVGYSDLLRGERSGSADDFVLWRGDDVPAYNLAVVVDDADEGVGEVVRGDDLLETTARQVLLGELLGLPTPRYAHVPLVLAADGARLAKRHGAVALSDRLALGESPEQLVGWMAWSSGLRPSAEPARAASLVADFDPMRIAREPTVLGPGLGLGLGEPDAPLRSGFAAS
jgi:glutamyl-tRNA synthetase